MLKFFSIVTLALGILILPSCQKEDVIAADAAPNFSQGILVLNQGDPSVGQDVSLSFVVSGSEIYRHAFEQANDRPLEGIGHDLVEYEGAYYVSLNDPGQVVQLDKDLKSTGELTGLGQIADIAFLSSEKAFVSGTQGITIFNPTTMTLLGTMSTDLKISRLLVANGNVYALAPDEQMILAIDAQNDQLINTFSTGENAVSMILDPNSRLMVLCQEDGSVNQPTIRLYTLSNNVQVKKYAYGAPGAAVRDLYLDPASQKTYFVYNTSIRRVDADLGSFVSCTASGGASLLHYPVLDPVTGYLYATDVVGVGERGHLYKFDVEDGSTINKYNLDFQPIEYLFVNP